MFDGAAFGREMAAEVKNIIGLLNEKIAGLEVRIKELEAVEWVPGPPGPPGPKGDKGDDGEDGVGFASAFIDRDGCLVLTFTDGTVGTIGPVVGKDGLPGKDGAPGRDGQDGLGFDDFEEALSDDGQHLIRRWKRGEIVKEFKHRIAFLKWVGVFRDGETYQPQDVVTCGGSIWLANKETKGKPGISKDWTLIVKCGRDGRDGKSIKGAKGDPGRPGRDLTQMAPDGSKW